MRGFRESDSRPLIQVLALHDEVDHVGVFVVVPPGEVFTILAPGARPGVLPLTAAVVQTAVLAVAYGLLYLIMEIQTENSRFGTEY